MPQVQSCLGRAVGSDIIAVSDFGRGTPDAIFTAQIPASVRTMAHAVRIIVFMSFFAQGEPGVDERRVLAQLTRSSAVQLETDWGGIRSLARRLSLEAWEDARSKRVRRADRQRCCTRTETAARHRHQQLRRSSDVRWKSPRSCRRQRSGTVDYSPRLAGATDQKSSARDNSDHSNCNGQQRIAFATRTPQGCMPGREHHSPVKRGRGLGR